MQRRSRAEARLAAHVYAGSRNSVGDRVCNCERKEKSRVSSRVSRRWFSTVVRLKGEQRRSRRRREACGHVFAFVCSFPRPAAVTSDGIFANAHAKYWSCLLSISRHGHATVAGHTHTYVARPTILRFLQNDSMDFSFVKNFFSLVSVPDNPSFDLKTVLDRAR